MRRTRRTQRTTADGEDRLSALPDCILSHILSFLDTRYAVQTCVLSKRFVNLWSSLPVLNFDSGSCKRLKSFSKLVDEVLTLRDHSVKVYDCNFINRRALKPHSLEKAVNYAMSHGVLRLQIRVNTDEFRRFPESGYSSESLTNFKLKNDGWLTELVKPFYFPKLRTLHLERISFTHSNLFSGCQCLRDLILINCGTNKLDTWNIDAPRLTKLAISCVAWWIKCKVIVSAPRLASFCYRGQRPLLLSMGELSDLEVINIDIDLLNYTGQMITQEVNKKDALNLMNMLRPFHNAKSVSLSLDTIEVLSVDPDLLAQGCTLFGNKMKSLKLKSSRRISTVVIPSNMMAYLLNGSPHSEVSVEFPRCRLHAQHKSCNYCRREEHFGHRFLFPE